MPSWKVTREGGPDETILAPDLSRATEKAQKTGPFSAVMLIEDDASPALASGLAKLVDMGFTPEEAGAIADGA